MSSKAFSNYTPAMYLNLVRKYELPAGSYNDNGTPYPDDCLVIYGTTNGRDGKQAAKEFVEEIIDASFGKTDEGIFKHLAARLDSAIARSRVKTKLLTIDIDSKDEWPEVKEFLAQHKIKPAALIETRGGYHVMLDVDDLPALKGELHKKFSIKHTIGDMMCAVPGTIQGGFPVRFVR